MNLLQYLPQFFRRVFIEFNKICNSICKNAQLQRGLAATNLNLSLVNLDVADILDMKLWPAKTKSTKA